MIMPSALCAQFEAHILEETKHILLANQVTGKDESEWVRRAQEYQEQIRICLQQKLQAYKDSAPTVEIWRAWLLEWDVQNEGNGGGCEAADLGLVGSQEDGGGRETDSGSGSNAGSVIIRETQGEDSPMRRCRSVLGMGSREGSRGDETRERPFSPRGPSGCGAGDSEGDVHGRGGSIGCDSAGESVEGSGGGVSSGLRDGGGGGRRVGGDTANCSGGGGGLAVSEKEFSGSRRVCAVQGVHGG